MKYLNIIKIVIILSLLSCDSFNKLSQSLADSKPSISVITTKDKLNTNATPVVFKNSISSITSTKSPVLNFDYTKCILFKDLVGYYDVYYVDNKINPAKQNGDSWATAFNTINAARNQVIENRIKNHTNKPALIAIASGHYTHTKEKAGNNEIISMYGLASYLYDDTYFFGGYKNGDACVNVQKNPNFYTTILDSEHKSSVITILANVKNVRFSHLTIQNGLTKNADNKRDGGGISIGSNSRIILNQITIKNSKSHNNGGCLAINNAEKVWINNLVLENCQALNGHGGGLFLSNVTDVEILGIKVSNAKGQQNGGALYGDNSKINFGYFLLNNNTAQNGAGIYLKNINFTIMTYVGDNSEGRTLTAAAADDADGSLISLDKPFNIINELRNNTASQNGGGIFIENAVDQAIDFERIKFIDNKANNGAGFYALNKVASIRLKNALFRDNKATQNGGAMYFNNGFDKFEALHDHVITDAKYNVGLSYTPIVIANHIINNSAGNQGGGIYVNAGLMNNTAYLFNETNHGIDIPLIFDGNKANNGGAIALGTAKIAPKIFIRGLYKNNQANESGVIHFNKAEGGDNIQLWGEFNNNQALNGDGAITKITTPIHKIRIAGNFVANKCTKNNHEHFCNGAAFNIANAQKIWVQANISEHQVTSKGAFLYSKKTNDVLIQNYYANQPTFITDNLAKDMGGVFYFKEINNNLEIDSKHVPKGLTRLQVSLNRAGSGGFLYANKILGNVTIDDALFTRNSANYGGALYFNGIIGDLSVKESLFHENLATIYGGAMYVESAHNAIFDGLRNKSTTLINKREYFDKASFNANKTWSTIDDYLDNLNEFDNRRSSVSISKNIFLAQNNVAQEGGFVYFGTINNLALDHMSMGNNKPQAISVWNLQGNIQGVNRNANDQIISYKAGYDNVPNIIYDDGKAIKDIKMFFDSVNWSDEYTLNEKDLMGIVGHNGYMYDNSKSNYKTKTGIVIQNDQNKNVPSVR